MCSILRAISILQSDSLVLQSLFTLPSASAIVLAQQEGTMKRERTLKVVLVLVGLLFVAGIYPLIVMLRQEPALAMMMSLYVTLGVFLLLPRAILPRTAA
jgi:hypothetical protein